MRVLGGLLAVIGLGAGCSSADSAHVKTSAISAAITVSTGDRGGVSYEVHLSSGASDVDLTGDDTVVGETTDYKVTLEKAKFLGRVVYRGNIVDTDARPGEEMTVRLQRRGSETSAPGSIVAMPAAVEISSPAVGTSVSRSTPVTFALNDAPGAFRVTWIGTCLAENSAGLTFAAGTPVTIPAGSLKPADSASAAASCDVTFMVTRLLSGTVDPAYAGGAIHSERTVALVVTSAP